VLYFLRLGTFGFGGAIAGAAFVLGRRAIVDLPTAMIFLCTFTILRTTKKVVDPILIVLAGIAGLILSSAR